MELFKSLETRTKLFKDPFKHFEINQPLTQKAINEICNAEIADPRKQNLNYDGVLNYGGCGNVYDFFGSTLLMKRQWIKLQLIKWIFS